MKAVPVTPLPSGVEHASEFVTISGSSLITLPREGSGVPLRIPGNGGATVLVMLETKTVTANTQGTAVLFGVLRSGVRVAIAVGYPEEEHWVYPAFLVSGLPFAAYEIAVHGATGMVIRAVGLVGVGGAAEPSIKVDAQLARRDVSQWQSVSLPDVWYRERWIETLRDPTGRIVSEITASDVTDILEYPDRIMVGTTGAYRIRDWSGSDATLTLTAGVEYEISPTRLYATGPIPAGTMFGIYRRAKR